jgi:hypothetical protein
LRFLASFISSKLISTRTLTSVAATLLTIASIATPVSMGVTAAQKSQAAQNKSIAATEQLSESTGLHHDQLSIYPKLVKSRIDDAAANTVARAQAVTKQVGTKADTAPLTAVVRKLQAYATLDASTVQKLTVATDRAIVAVKAAAAKHDRDVAAALAAADTPGGAQAVARNLASSMYGWGDGEFQCLVSLWDKESGWNYQSYNSSSGAGGIPQALPASKMASAGSDWATNAATQIKWGLGYIARGYGSPCAAWSHSQAMNWY